LFLLVRNPPTGRLVADEPLGFRALPRGEEVFAHFSEIQGSGHKSLKEKQRVSYEVTRGQKGLKAAGIKPL